jgi:RHS repeat-associated protein
MLPAAKHFDLVLGIDVHIVLVPGVPPVPTPVPIPFTGLLFDPMDYLPGGATVRINGLPRAHAGTAAIAMPPHVPIGGPFLKPPANDGELFMGSSSVVVDGEPQGYAMLPVLTCQDIGMPAPLRAGKTSAARSLYLPTSMVLPIPTPRQVLVGGAPIVSLTYLHGKLLDAGTKKVRGMFFKSVHGTHLDRKLKGASLYLNGLADRVFDKLGLSKDGALRNKVSRKICTVTGHPVDVATGKVFTDFVDLTLPGPLPFELERVWFSSSDYDGPLGHGWHASFDMALAADEHVVGVRLGDGRVVLFPALHEGESHFHAGERLTLVRDALGYGLRDAASGHTYHFVAGALTKLEDRAGSVVLFNHERGCLREIVDSGGRSWTLQWSGGRITALEGPHPEHESERVVYHRWSYDEAGNLHAATDALGHAQRFAYRDHMLVRETLKSGLSFHFEYDGEQRCTRTWGDGGIYDHKLSYDPLFNLTTVENSLGFKTQYEHDGAMVHRTLDAFGNETRTEYGEGYRVLAEIDELGQRSVHEYDARGNLTKTTLPDGATLSVEYEGDLCVRAVDALGGAWTWTRDSQGRELTRTDPLGNVSRTEYSGSHCVGQVDAAGGRTSVQYDARGEVVAVATPDGAITRYEHDFLGRTVATVDACGARQSRKLDLLGRTLRTQEADGNVRTLAYDAEGNVVHARDAQHDVRFAYQGMNRLASRSEAGHTVQFRYDTEEQLTAVVNEHGSIYRFELGPTGKVDKEHGFDGIVRKYQRDCAGRVTRVDRPGDRFSEYSYDAAGRVLEVTHHDGSVESYSYRADGSLLSATNDDASVEFERDALGRVLRESQCRAWVDSEYDALGMRIRMQSSIGVDQRIARNAMGDVLGVDAAGFSATFERDALGRELARALPAVRSQWQRDAAGRPTVHLVDGATPLRAVGYQWDANDRLRSIIDSERGPSTYRHDALGNLAWATYPDGTTDLRLPDAVGNLFRTETRTDREYGRAGQLLVARSPQGETRYSYDAEGNLLTKTEPSGACWHYTWNAAGMLAAAKRPDGSTVSFAYDALGRRVSKTYRGQTTRWVWDGNVPLHECVEGSLSSLADADGVPWVGDSGAAELDAWLSTSRGSKAQPITWLFEPESFAPMARVCGTETQSIVCDHLGTPVLVAAGDGQRVWSAEISAYGELRTLVGARWACPFRWPGQYEDPETGLYYNRFRYYDSESGQYASSDPLGQLGNGYRYAADVLRMADVFGLFEEWVDPQRINFSQAYVEGDAVSYERAMRDGTWDWSRKSKNGTSVAVLNVAEVDGQLVSFDNRRLLAARNAGLDAVPVQRVDLRAPKPGTKITWGESLARRLNSAPKNSGLPKVQLPRTGSPGAPTVVKGCR